MKLILRDRKQDMVDAWKTHFKGVPNVEIDQGDIFDVTADALVSPANSYGFMNGGIDLVYARKFGPEMEQRLRDQLVSYHYGELLVGEAVKVLINDLPKGNPTPFKYLISAPTMRVPMDIRGTVNAYLAMRAVLKIATESYDDPIESILCPGLGTAIGMMDVNIAAHQMRQAWAVVMEGKQLPAQNIAQVYGGHEAMRRGLPYNGEDF